MEQAHNLRSKVVQTEVERYTIRIQLQKSILKVTNQCKESGQIYDGQYKYQDLSEWTKTLFQSLEEIFDTISQSIKDEPTSLQVDENGGLRLTFNFKRKTKYVEFPTKARQMKREQLIQHSNALLKREISTLKQQFNKFSQADRLHTENIQFKTQKLQKEMEQKIEHKIQNKIQKLQQQMQQKTMSLIQEVLKNSRAQKLNFEKLIKKADKERIELSQKAERQYKLREEGHIQMNAKYQRHIESLKSQLESMSKDLAESKERIYLLSGKLQIQQNRNLQLKDEQQILKKNLQTQDHNIKKIHNALNLGESSYTKAKFQVDKSTQVYKEFYECTIQDGYQSITKIKQSEEWKGVLSKTALRDKKIYYFQVQSKGHLNLGIVCQSLKNEIFRLESTHQIYLSFNGDSVLLCGNGQDRIVTKFVDKIRQVTVITVIVDLASEIISWHYNGKVQISSGINQNLLSEKIYLSLGLGVEKQEANIL